MPTLYYIDYIETQTSVTVGETLVCTNGVWTNNPTSFTYQWQLDGTTNISGATNSSYIIQQFDLGHTIGCKVTAIGALGTTEVSTSNPIAVLALMPTNNTLPVITGNIVVGQTLSTTNGSWTNSPTSYTYQWKRNNVSIVNATTNSYSLVVSDVSKTMTCVVTASNTSGNVLATSSSVGPILPLAPSNSILPVITGSTQVGKILTSTSGTWLSIPTSYSYQWIRGTNDVITNAVSITYTTTVSDIGYTIRCEVSASNAGGSSTISSVNTEAIFQPTLNYSLLVFTEALDGSTANIATITLAGVTFSANTGTNLGSKVTNVPIGLTPNLIVNSPTSAELYFSGYALDPYTSSTNVSVTLTDNDFVNILASDIVGSGATVSNISINNSAVHYYYVSYIDTPSTAKVGVTAICSVTTTLYGANYTYQWQQDSNVAIVGATNSNYILTPNDIGHTIDCIATASGSFGIASVDSNTIMVLAPVLHYSVITFNEMFDGKITSISTITLENDVFSANMGDDLGARVINVILGLTAHIIITSNTTATLSFTGSAQNLYQNANNITITFIDSDFVNCPASVIVGYSVSNVSIVANSSPLVLTASSPILGTNSYNTIEEAQLGLTGEVFGFSNVEIGSVITGNTVMYGTTTRSFTIRSVYI
jgi:hypothetical protein